MRTSDGDALLATLELDLDSTLRFSRGLILLSERSLQAREGEDGAWQRWDLRAGLALQHHDHAGIGTLELMDSSSGAPVRLATWRYTLEQNVAALRLIEKFDKQLEAVVNGRPQEAEEVVACPTCKALLEPGQEECPICTRELQTPPSTWTLFRLWRFARPYRWQLLAGFLLTLASTGATLIPPYLTMPLMDEVLIPFQNGKPMNWSLAGMYMAGLLGAAAVAWVLGWIRTYILARVSERIGRDLRTTTYRHLMDLSLEYFGGKRTGDLMARIGNETDRINIFLSLDLLKIGRAHV